LNWWKPRAIKRYRELKQQNKLQTEPLWMDDIAYLSWDQTKAKYL